MGPLKISAVGLLGAMALAACASNGASTHASSPDSTSVTTTTSGTPTPQPASAPASSPNDARDPSATMLTSANVSSLVAAPTPSPSREAAPRWTDEQIVAALAAAQETEDELRVVRDKSKSARVDRLATQMLMDQRELTLGQAALARKIPAQQSEMSSRAADARRQVTDAVGAPGSSTYDRHFIDAEMSYCRAILQLLDTEMIPSARSADLKQYLQNFRAKTASRLLQAQEIDGQIK